MTNTTLCYLKKNGAYLMLHRVKKINDPNADKWMGIGGHLEEGESPHDCARREIFEETGLTVEHPVYRGLVTFVSDKYGTEYMHLFTAEEFSGELIECNEGVLEWVACEDVPKLPIWEGDKIFLRLLDEESRFFSLKLEYEGDTLIRHALEI